jgi:hypothetical protein
MLTNLYGGMENYLRNRLQMGRHDANCLYRLELVIRD